MRSLILLCWWKYFCGLWAGSGRLRKPTNNEYWVLICSQTDPYDLGQVTSLGLCFLTSKRGLILIHLIDLPYSEIGPTQLYLIFSLFPLHSRIRRGIHCTWPPLWAGQQMWQQHRRWVIADDWEWQFWLSLWQLDEGDLRGCMVGGLDTDIA